MSEFASANRNLLRPLRILVLSTTFYPKINGTTLAVAELVESLAQRNHKVYLVTRRLKGTKSEELWKNVSVRRVGLQRGTFLSRALVTFQLCLVSAMLIRKERIDVIHANGFVPLVAAVIVGRMFSIPTVASLHGLQRLWFGEARWRSDTEFAITFAPEKLAINEADQIIAQSNELKLLLRELYGVDLAKVMVIPHPVDLEIFGYKPPNQNGQIVLFVGTLGRIHGPDLLLKSSPHVLREFPNARFLFVGKGPMRSKLEQMASDLGVKNSMSLLGEVRSRAELSELYSSATVIVIPLRYKGYILSKVAVEAMAVGRPVLTTMKLDPQLGRHGVYETGLLPFEIAQGIINILKLGSGAYSRVSLSARKYVEETCAEPKVTSKIEGIYYSLCFEKR